MKRAELLRHLRANGCFLLLALAVSVGTEKMLVDFGRANLTDMAR